MDQKKPHFLSPPILRPGELKSLTTIDIVVLNTSGQNYMRLDVLEWFIDAINSFHWGTTKWVWDLAMGSRENGAKVRCSRKSRSYNSTVLSLRSCPGWMEGPNDTTRFGG